MASLPLDFTLNGQACRLAVEPDVTLLDALRERLGLTGTKKGCDHGQCGACTVLADGRRINACLTLAVMQEGRHITTIEGLSDGDTLHGMQQAFIDRDAFQCGYCTPGQICSAVGLLAEAQRYGRLGEYRLAPDSASHAGQARQAARAALREAMSGNLCRCGAYPHIVDAIAQQLWPEQLPWQEPGQAPEGPA